MADLDLAAIWTPKPTQAAFIDLIAKAARWDLIAYVGAFGSGKSAVLCRAAIGLSLTYPGIIGLVGREEFTDLRDTTQVEFFQQVAVLETAIREQLPQAQRGAWAGLGHHKRDTNDYLWANGSRTLFRPLQEAERKYKSLTLGFFAIDEVSEVDHDRQDPGSVLMLQGRLRQVGMPCVGFMVSNPVGFDHWLFRWYGKDAVKGADGVWRGPKGLPCVRTNTLENVDNLPPGYVENLRKNYPPDHVRRYLEGEWGGIDEGAPVFPTFDVDRHVRPLTWQRRWPVKIGIDLGTNLPGVVWGQIDPVAERLHILRSWLPRNLDVYKLAEGIKQRNEAWFPHGTFDIFCGHDGNARKDTNEKSSAEILATYGLAPHVRYTAKERGFSTLRSLLETRDDGLPALFVDPSNAVVIEGFAGGYRYDPKKEFTDETLDKGPYPPAMDAVRYIAVNTMTTAGRVPVIRAMSAFRRSAAR